ncbi:MAG: hypothetical protein KC613_18100 [Myxococcales bacterium]|nr:hypothetical protein [Myxococcales bacterium]MCB9522939.1 hypothetical protein [Myxococcales bacterium]
MRLTCAHAGLLFSAATLGACGDATETGNAQSGPVVSLRMTLQAAQDPTASTTVLDGDGAAIRVRSATARLRRIDLALPDGVRCEDWPGATAERCPPGEDRVRFEGPWQVDLLTGAFSPPLGDAAVPAGTYRRVEVRFDDDAGPALAIEAETAAGNGLAFTLSADPEYRFVGAAVVPGQGVASLLMALPVDAWFAGPVARCVDDGAYPSQQGVAQVGQAAGGCPGVAEAAEAALEGEGELRALEGDDAR